MAQTFNSLKCDDLSPLSPAAARRRELFTRLVNVRQAATGRSRPKR